MNKHDPHPYFEALREAAAVKKQLQSPALDSSFKECRRGRAETGGYAFMSVFWGYVFLSCACMYFSVSVFVSFAVSIYAIS